MQKKTNINKKRKLIFYILMVSLPILQYLIFYVYVNFNSLLLSFQEYKVVDNKQVFAFNIGDLFANYRTVFDEILHARWMGDTIANSARLYFTSLIVVTPLALLFSFYIIKKYKGSKFFRIVLFMPTIISSIVLVFIYQVLVDNIIPDLLVKKLGWVAQGDYGKFQLLTNAETRFNTLLFFCLFLSFGVNVLMYSGAMSGVSEEIVEAAHIDGCGDFRELIHIILPSVYPTLTTFIVVGVAGFFTNQMHIYDMYGGGDKADSSIWTLGYYMYKSTVSGEKTKDLYPYLSAMGIVFTLIAAPISIFVKWAMEKFGPSVD